MTGSSRLRRLRTAVDRLSSDDGSYVVACADSGRRPSPLEGTRFDTYEAAERAAAAATRYQRLLGELDPGRPVYRFAVYERDGGSLTVSRIREPTGERRANGLPRSVERVTLSSERDGEWLRLENAPVVHLSSGAEPFDDDVVAGQLERKL